MRTAAPVLSLLLSLALSVSASPESLASVEQAVGDKVSSLEALLSRHAIKARDITLAGVETEAVNVKGETFTIELGGTFGLTRHLPRLCRQYL